VWTLLAAFGVFLLFAAAVFVALCLYGFFALIQCRIVKTRAEAEAQVITAHHEPVPDKFTLSLRQTAASRPVASAPALPDLSPSLVPHHEWWPNVHNYHSHMDLVGPNTSGKTTLATAILAERAKTDKILICDPHRKFNQWADLPAIGVGRDFAAIEAAIHQVYAEFHRRFQPDESVDEPLTIFLDEYPSYPLHIPSVIPLIKQMLRESPKAGIRLVMLAQEPNGKIWGFDGEAAIRKNLMHILLGSLPPRSITWRPPNNTRLSSSAMEKLSRWTYRDCPSCRDRSLIVRCCGNFLPVSVLHSLLQVLLHLREQA
jgi:hypothetical protein